MENPLIYWDGAFKNFNVTPQPIIISETRNQPLVLKPTEYKICVDSFSIDSTRFAIFTALPRQTGATTINELNYYFQVSWGAFVYTQFLDMVTVNSWNTPNSVSPTNNLSNQPYYAIQSYGQFIQIINNALSALYTQLLAAPAYPAQASPPFMQLNADSGILALIVPQTFTTNNVSIVVGGGLMSILNLPFSSEDLNASYAPIPAPNISFVIGSQMYAASGYTCVRTSSAFPLGTAPWAFPSSYLCTDHDYRASWFDVSQILVISNLASPESVSTATDQPSIQSGNLQVLASYTLDLVGTDHINGQILYTPFIRKWLTLAPSSAISQINIQFMYTDRAGRVYPILQSFGRMAQIRLLFQKMDSKGTIERVEGIERQIDDEFIRSKVRKLY